MKPDFGFWGFAFPELRLQARRGGTKREAMGLQEDPFSSSGKPRGCFEKPCWTGPDPSQLQELATHPAGSEPCGTLKRADFSE